MRNHMVKAYIDESLNADLIKVCQALRCSQSAFIAASLTVNLNMLTEFGGAKRKELAGQLELLEGGSHAENNTSADQA